MTHDNFNWKERSGWEIDYYQHFIDFKQALAKSVELFYPDYELEWIMRTDASDLAVGGVLFQLCNGIPQPLFFLSQKFSKTALNWNTIEKECYGIYFCVHEMSYYLRCKQFTLETDHRNLLWMASSLVPKIMRWYIYLQSFNLILKHIPGKQNIVADFLFS